MIIVSMTKMIEDSFLYSILWMFFAASFAKFIVSRNDIIPEIIIVKIIAERFEMVIFGNNWDIAAAAPVLVLFIE